MAPYLYFMAVPSGYCKIGVAVNPWSRLKELQTGNPEPITLHGAWEIDNIPGCGARDVERVLHSMLSEFRTIGEWFLISVIEAMGLLEPACESLNDWRQCDM
jgi:Meiotically up-regulated gene 113